MTDMRFHTLLEEKLAAAGIHPLSGPAPELPAAKVASRAGNLLLRQASRLMIRAKELMGHHQSDRAIEELNEGIELMMALLDIVRGERELDLQLGYMYAAMVRYFEDARNRALSDRYLDLAVAIFERVKDEVERDPEASSELASTIKGLGEIYYNRGELDPAIRHYRAALEIVPDYSYAWHDLFGALYVNAQRGTIDLEALRQALEMTKVPAWVRQAAIRVLGRNTWRRWTAGCGSARSGPAPSPTWRSARRNVLPLRFEQIRTTARPICYAHARRAPNAI